MNFKTYLLLLYILFNSSIYSQGFWEKLNGPPGGQILSIAIDENNKNRMMVGTSSRGRIFITSNSGQSWSQTNISFTRSISALHFTNNGYLIAAISSKGIYRSTDGGITWKYVGAPQQRITAITKTSNNYLFAVTLNNRVYRSTDEGNIWRLIYSPNIEGDAFSIHTLHNDHILIGQTKHLHRSTDYGNNWEVIEGIFQQSQRIHAISSDSTGNVYIGTGFVNAFFYSSDNGNTWVNTDTNHILNHYGFTSVIINEDYLLGSVWNPENTVNFFPRSRDNGYNWEFLPTDIYWPDGKFIRGNDNIIYFAHWGGAGVYKSSDFGESWEHISDGLNNAYSTIMTFDENEHLYAASWQGYMYKSTDKGMNWEKLPIPNYPFEYLHYSFDKILYAATDIGLFYSTDKGNSWIKTNPMGNQYLRKVMKDKQGMLYVSLVQSGLWRSRNNGIDWERISTTFFSQDVDAIAIDSSGNLYAGTEGGFIYKSTNQGDSWTLEITGFSASSIVRFITVANDSSIFASARYDGIFHSSNGGQSWVKITDNLPANVYFDVAINNKNELFVSLYEDGIYYSNDLGNSWINITDNLPRTRIQNIIFDKEGYIYLGTEESAFKSKDTVVTGISVKEFDELPSSYNLSQNYPNPFNPVTTIKYQLPEDGFVTLKVYDVLGKEVAQLAKQHRTAGSYTVNFDASNLSSGLYIYEIRVNDFVQQRKMMLLK